MGEPDTFWQRWGAVCIVTWLFLLSLIGQGYFSAEAQIPRPEILAAVFENWQSEFLQLAVQAVVLMGLDERIFRAGRKDHEALMVRLDEMERRLAHA